MWENSWLLRGSWESPRALSVVTRPSLSVCSGILRGTDVWLEIVRIVESKDNSSLIRVL